MNVVLLGGATHAGARLAALLRESGWARPVLLRPQDPDAPAILRKAGALVDCSGTPWQATSRAAEWSRACGGRAQPRIVVLGSSQVYGGAVGRVREGHALEGGGRSARAWRAVEAHARTCADAGARVVVLRAGPLWGAGHPAVGRLARWLRDRTLGDLGEKGDGWSNLVPVDDACVAVVRALQLDMAPGEWRALNLAAPDSPRWNELFVDLALALGATPVRRVPPWRLAATQWMSGALHQARLALGTEEPGTWPPPLAREERQAWCRQQRLDATAATLDLCMNWTPYPVVLAEAAGWELRQESLAGLDAASRQGRQPLPARPKA